MPPVNCPRARRTLLTLDRPEGRSRDGTTVYPPDRGRGIKAQVSLVDRHLEGSWAPYTPYTNHSARFEYLLFTS